MHSSDVGTVHIIGAGLAGLAAAVRLARSHTAVAIHEATAQAGGRCRSYYDQATGMMIDNGVHLLLSGNHAALSYAETIGSVSGLHGPAEAEFSFIDLASRIWQVAFLNRSNRLCRINLLGIYLAIIYLNGLFIMTPQHYTFLLLRIVSDDILNLQ